MAEPIRVQVSVWERLAEWLQQLLRRYPDLQPVEENADVLVVDSSRSEFDRLADRWRDPVATARTVVITSGFLALLPWIERGVQVFFHLDDPDEELAAAVRHAARREQYSSSSVALALGKAVALARCLERRRMPPAVQLTRQEQEVASLAARLLPNAVIADRLGVSGNTVKSHLRRAYAKLGVHRRAQLLARLEGAPQVETPAEGAPG